MPGACLPGSTGLAMTTMSIVGQPDGGHSRALRSVCIVVGLVLLGSWGASAVPVINNWSNPVADGFEAIPVLYASLIVLPIGIVVPAGALRGSPRGMRAARGGLIAAGVVAMLLARFFGFMLSATIMNWG
jgi:hypothetical protein